MRDLWNRISCHWRGWGRYRRLSAPPIVIGGCERSGTTLLHSMVSALPGVHAIGPETWALCYARQAGFSGDRPVRMSRLIRHLGEAPIEPEARRWSEKSPANLFYFDEIRKSVRGVRLLQIVRDGRDVVTSVHPKRPDGPWVGARRWKNAARACLRQRGRDDVLTLRYRDAVRDPEGTMESICSFIDEPFGAEAREWWKHASVRSSGNLVAGEVGRPHGRSIDKFRRDDFVDRWNVVEDMNADSEALDLLDAFGFLTDADPTAAPDTFLRRRQVDLRARRRRTPGASERSAASG